MAEEDLEIREVKRERAFLDLAYLIGWKGFIAIVTVIFISGQVFITWQKWSELLSNEAIAEYARRGQQIKNHAASIKEMKQELIRIESALERKTGVLHRRISKIGKNP